jgi:hypothetical protein
MAAKINPNGLKKTRNPKLKSNPKIINPLHPQKYFQHSIEQNLGEN